MCPIITEYSSPCGRATKYIGKKNKKKKKNFTTLFFNYLRKCDLLPHNKKEF
jgi:hypothetical protein